MRLGKFGEFGFYEAFDHLLERHGVFPTEESAGFVGIAVRGDRLNCHDEIGINVRLVAPVVTNGIESGTNSLFDAMKTACGQNEGIDGV
jgi:hypothetical protein